MLEWVRNRLFALFESANHKIESDYNVTQSRFVIGQFKQCESTISNPVLESIMFGYNKQIKPYLFLIIFCFPPSIANRRSSVEVVMNRLECDY